MDGILKWLGGGGIVAKAAKVYATYSAVTSIFGGGKKDDASEKKKKEKEKNSSIFNNTFVKIAMGIALMYFAPELLKMIGVGGGGGLISSGIAGIVGYKASGMLGNMLSDGKEQTEIQDVRPPNDDPSSFQLDQKTTSNQSGDNSIIKALMGKNQND